MGNKEKTSRVPQVNKFQIPSIPTWLSLLVIFAAAFFLFYPSLSYYFFQDDWFVLNWVRTNDLSSFFSFRTDIIYWRPLSMPLLFFSAQKIFNLNPLGYHLVTFSIFFALIIAIYKLFLLLTKSTKLSLISSFLYATWPIHFISLSWFSTTSYILAPLLQVVSFTFFIKFSEKKKSIFLITSFAFFALGVASSEFSLVLPVILLVWALALKKQNYLKILLPYFIVDAIYFFTRFILFPIPARDDYQLFLSTQILNNYIWYGFWSLGIPESFKSLIFPSLPEQSIKVILQFWKITVPFFVISLILAITIFTNFRKNPRFYIFGLVWFTLGLLPVITFASHSFPVYLSFAGLGFLFIVTNSLNKSNNLLWVLFLIIWTITSFNSTRFTQITHWIRNEQAISRAYINYTKEKIPTPQPNSVFLFKPADLSFSKEHYFFIVETEDTLRQSLADQNALHFIYNDSTLQSLFATHQQKVEIPKDVNFYEISPRGNK